MNSPHRRAAVALAALVLGACLFCRQIADALVIRGDDFLYRNDMPNAQRRYERALEIDRGNEAAADRLAFLGMEQRTPVSLRRSIDIATIYLTAHPSDTVILADRALCYLIERRYLLALADFERAGRLTRDARYLTFAGWAARHADRRDRARALWKAALAINPQFSPAHRALEQQ